MSAIWKFYWCLGRAECIHSGCDGAQHGPSKHNLRRIAIRWCPDDDDGRCYYYYVNKCSASYEYMMRKYCSVLCHKCTSIFRSLKQFFPSVSDSNEWKDKYDHMVCAAKANVLGIMEATCGRTQSDFSCCDFLLKTQKSEASELFRCRQYNSELRAISDLSKSNTTFRNKMAFAVGNFLSARSAAAQMKTDEWNAMRISLFIFFVTSISFAGHRLPGTLTENGTRSAELFRLNSSFIHPFGEGK